MSRDPRSVLFVINVDWFFLSHFTAFAAAAKQRGYVCQIACETTDRRGALEAAGLEVLPLGLSRGKRSLAQYWSASRQLAQFLKQRRPSIVHAIGLEAVATTALARRFAGRSRFIFAPTGLGSTSLRAGLKGDVWQRLVPTVLRGLAGVGAGWIFENGDDPGLFGFSGLSPDMQVVGGAGADLAAFRPAPLPQRPPLRVGMVSRMIWSKGPDLAVAAVAALRRSGAAIELTLVGDPDPFNPRPIPDATLRQWNETEGVRWTGRRRDIADVWAAQHVACLPSRGGEGLPKSLIEAAACGRALVTTNVPGCRSLVRDGIEGFVVEPDDVGALAGALRRFIDEPGLVERMGSAARQRVVAGYSDKAVATHVVDFYDRLLART